MSEISSMHDTGEGIIELRGVEKRYGEHVAVRDMSLTVARGATYGLLGPNGAGKTTTIRMILQILDPDAGEIRIFGRPADRNALSRIGYLPEERGVYRRMRVRRLLEFFAELKGVAPSRSRPLIHRWLERLGLEDRIQARVQELSKGMQQKLQFIAAVLHDPEIVILDEPFGGLDPINQQVLKDIIADMQRQGRTILFSTHLIVHAERICDHVCIIARGAKVLDGPVAAVRRQHGSGYVAIAAEEWTPEGRAALRNSPIVAHLREDGPEAEVRLRDGAEAHELLPPLIASGLRLRRFERVEPSLEQIFIERVGESPAESPGLREAARV